MRHPLGALLLRGAAAAFALAASAQPLLAASCTTSIEGVELTAADRGRLENLEASRFRGLSAALLSERAADREAVSALFANGLAPVDTGALVGDYQCRTIKLGGISDLVVYGWFACRIGDITDVLTISKTTGSQNFSGELYVSGDRLIYRGAGHYSDEAPKAYRDEAERDQVGCLSAVEVGARHYVIELPAPQFESLYDLIELRR